MKVLYHVGEAVGKDTILKKGRIQEYTRPLVIEAEDTSIVLDAIKKCCINETQRSRHNDQTAK